MKIGIPREVKNNEHRVAITPSGVRELLGYGHDVVVEQEAGVGSSILDEEYVAAGAKILASAQEVWAFGELILKVKEPVAEEYPRMPRGPAPTRCCPLAPPPWRTRPCSSRTGPCPCSRR